MKAELDSEIWCYERFCTQTLIYNHYRNDYFGKYYEFRLFLLFLGSIYFFYKIILLFNIDL